MKKNTVVYAAVMAVMVFFTAAVSGIKTEVSAGGSSNDMAGTDRVSVIFSHDMHSHMDEERDGNGGFAKLRTAAEDIKKSYPDSFMLDAGDFSMGTPYQTIFSEEASELKMMGYIGFDASTFGNHEFDYRASGLADMLKAAKGSGPELVAANIDWEETLADEELQEEGRKLFESFRDYGAKEYTVIERGGIRAAVFGIIGESAVDYAPESGLIFEDAHEAASRVVETIKSKEDYDIIICLSHCGTVENEKDRLEETEDFRLAEDVPDIDLIISGHTHTELAEPVEVDGTYIVSCGSYNSNTGHIVLEKDRDSEDYRMASYELISLDQGVEPDKDTERKLEKYRSLVNERYFSIFGYDTNQVISENTIDFPAADELGLTQGEEPLGSLIADSYRYAVKKADGVGAEIAIVPLGVIRGTLDKGGITVGDVFNVSSLGYGKDGLPGYPLVKAYLTGRELKAVAEVDASISEFMGVARLYSSGLEYSWNPNRLILNRAVDVGYDAGEGREDIEDDRLYSVTADLYSCQMLGTVKDKSMGLLKIEPKDENGKIIENFEDHIVYDGDKELKAWYALASYIDSFEGGTIPEYYAGSQGRKVLIDSFAPSELLKQPNRVAVMAVSVIVTVVVLAVTIILVIRRRKRRGLEK